MTPPDPTPPWLTPAEAAAYARVGPGTLARWIEEGRLRPAVTRNKRDLRGRGANGYVIERADLDALLRALKVNVAAAGEPEAASAPRQAARRGGAAGAAAFMERIRRGQGG